MKRSAPLRRSEFKRKAKPPPARVVPARAAIKPIAPAQRPRATLTPVAAVVRAIPKNPRQKNARLLDLARGRPCLLRWRPGCAGAEGSTTVACHANGHASGKGLGYKAHDWRSVWGCYVCHTEFDQGGHPAEVLQPVFDAAWLLQISEWEKIALAPATKPADAKAARWALERAATFKGADVEPE